MLQDLIFLTVLIFFAYKFGFKLRVDKSMIDSDMPGSLIIETNLFNQNT